MNWKYTLSFVTLFAVPPSLLLADMNGFPIIEQGKAAGTALVEALHDPLAILGKRSPGARGEARLSNTKKERIFESDRKREASAGGPFDPTTSGPRERVLANMRERPEIVPLSEIDGLPEFAFVPEDGLMVPAPQGFGSPSLPFGPGPIFAPIVPGSPGDNGNPAGPTPTDPTDPPQPVAMPVPEPTSWISMILGFFATGAIMRRVRRKVARKPIIAGNVLQA